MRVIEKNSSWIHYSWSKYWSKKIFFQLNISDILYTFIIDRTEQANLLDLKQKDFSFCVELPIKAKKMKIQLGSINSYERKRIVGKKRLILLKMDSKY